MKISIEVELKDPLRTASALELEADMMRGRHEQYAPTRPPDPSIVEFRSLAAAIRRAAL